MLQNFANEFFLLSTEIEVIQGYHSCYFDMEITKKTIDLYFKYSTEFTDLFEDMCFDSPEMRQTHETM